MSIPQIQTGKTPEEPLNVRMLLPLPADTPFGNLSLKYTMIIARLDHVNVMLRAVYESYERTMMDPFSGAVLHHALVSEQVIYWLRKTADEFVGLHYVLSSRAATGRYPDKVSPDSIGRALYGKAVAPLFTEHAEFLSVLNDISNAYKHSFVNSDLSLIGRDEPVVYALGLSQNDLHNEPAFHAVSLRDVVSAFNDFFATMVGYMRRCGIPHRAPPLPGGSAEGS